MGRKEIYKIIEERLAEIDDAILYDPGDGIGWIDPDGRGWQITVILTHNEAEATL